MLKLANDILERAILGKGLRSPLAQDEFTGDFAVSDGPDNVYRGIIDLITTRVGERLMFEDVGTSIPSALEEPTEGLIDALPLQVVNVLERFEPRVTRVRCTARQTTSSNSSNPNTVELNISYTIRATGVIENRVYPFYLSPEGGTRSDL